MSLFLLVCFFYLDRMVADSLELTLSAEERIPEVEDFQPECGVRVHGFNQLLVLEMARSLHCCFNFISLIIPNNLSVKMQEVVYRRHMLTIRDK